MHIPEHHHMNDANNKSSASFFEPLSPGSEGYTASASSNGDSSGSCSPYDSCSSSPSYSTLSHDFGEEKVRSKVVNTAQIANFVSLSEGGSSSSRTCAAFSGSSLYPPSTSSHCSSSEEEEDTLTSNRSTTRKRRMQTTNINYGSQTMHNGISILERSLKRHMCQAQVSLKYRQPDFYGYESGNSSDGSSVKDIDAGQNPIYTLGSDIMAHALSFLTPPEIHTLLTCPLSRTWRVTYTLPNDLWNVLCLGEPFYAKLRTDGDDSSSSDDEEYGRGGGGGLKTRFGRYRLLYTSFVRCMKYLTKVREDVGNGIAPSPMKEVVPSSLHVAQKGNYAGESNLHEFLKKTVKVVKKQSLTTLDSTPPADRDDKDGHVSVLDGSCTAANMQEKNKMVKKGKDADTVSKVKFGHSKLTERLFLSSQKAGVVGHVDLPWSCAIYSVVNWMLAFADVLGIQIMCLQALPVILENESQRTTAHLAGLTRIVLKNMVVFPDSVELHTAAFHTIVLLARPLGGKEGMLFHKAMVDHHAGIFTGTTAAGGGCVKKNPTTGHSYPNGIKVMLDSMKRFASDEALQTMACWSVVNVALNPTQKSLLVKMGGIASTVNAMRMHPFSSEVQFRALFALINLVIPCQPPSSNQTDRQEGHPTVQRRRNANISIERQMLDDNIPQITHLIVLAMKYFCSAEAILNRACLVLHNISLNPANHTTLLWTPNCYQMLEWCMETYASEKVIQQSAGGTLQRLQATLANNEDLRARFAMSLRKNQLDEMAGMQQ